jgi:hypothetical protein
VPFGIFGKTNSGKTITAKTLLIRALSQGCFVDGKPVRFIVFDAQSEYARGIGSSGNLGLFQYVTNDIHQLSIDPASTTPASTTPMFIDPGELTVFDWINAFWDCTPNMEACLKEMDKDRRQELARGNTTPQNADLAAYVNQFPDTYGSYPQYTVNAVWRRVQKFNEPIFRRFLTAPPSGSNHVMKDIYELIGSGKSIIIHFGKHGLDASIYMFVTNHITRKLYERYSMSVSDTSNTLPHLVLLVEEAHRFIPSAGLGFTGASYFHKIARETRKFGLTAGFIDQRPSKLDDEIVSQLGSRIIHRLDDPDDVKSALSGMNKQKWLPIASKLGIGESIFFGSVVGDIPTMIKPFWSKNIQDVKDFFGITTITPDMISSRNHRNPVKPAVARSVAPAQPPVAIPNPPSIAPMKPVQKPLATPVPAQNPVKPAMPVRQKICIDDPSDDDLDEDTGNDQENENGTT